MQTNNNQKLRRESGLVSHPAQEEWMAWLYGELSRGNQAKLTAHLKQCPECEARVGRWREAMGLLDEWEIAPHSLRRVASPPILKWAAAAAVILALGVGFGTGRLFSTGPRNSAALRKEIQREVSVEFKARWEDQRKQLVVEVTRAIEEKRAEDGKLILAALRQIDAAHRADYNSLRKELETVAVLTQNSLQQAQQQIINLASFSQSK